MSSSRSSSNIYNHVFKRVLQSFISLQLMIQAVRTWSFRGDIAIDDISVADGYCGK